MTSEFDGLEGTFPPLPDEIPDPGTGQDDSSTDSAPRSVATAAQPLAAATLYKWVDEDGQIRYSDRLPAEQTRKRHQQLNRPGVIVTTTEAAPTAEELAAEAEAKRKADAEASETARLKAIQDKKDQVLLMTFSNEEEIVEAQQERMDVIQSVISLLRKNIKNEEQKLAKLEQQAQTKYLDQNKTVPGGLAQNIEYFQEKILGIQQQLALKLEERERVKKQYVEDLLRYRELTRNAAAESNNPTDRH